MCTGASFTESLAKKLKTASIWKENANGEHVYLDQVTIPIIQLS